MSGVNARGDLVLGAVAYDPKVVTIWDGFRAWLRGQGLDFDYVLYSNYERQTEDLVAGRIGVAWNSPLAWVRARRLAAAGGVPLTPVVMRDTDRDLRSLVVVRADDPARSLADLRVRLVGTGAVDSPQSTLLPLALLRAAGLRPGAAGLRPGSDTRVRRFDIGVGLHGDHIGGERDAARALFATDPAEQVDAACMIDSNLLLFAREGLLPAGSVRVLARTEPYDHCIMAAGPAAGEAAVTRFAALLLGMEYADPALRPLLDMEGLKQWLPPRLSGYAQLERAVDESGFYDATGQIGGATTDLDGLGLDQGGHLLLGHALAGLRPGDKLTVTGHHPALGIHLAAWCREHGHRFNDDGPGGGGPGGGGPGGGGPGGGGPLVITKGAADEQRWSGASRAGAAQGPPRARADPRWGLAARGALVEAGGPPIGAEWTEREHVWADIAPRLYAAAAASQWDPATAVDWSAETDVPPAVERSVVQIMTYLVENEQAALIIPARLLSQLHPHFREVMQLLASQAADEARHVEVFSRRGMLSGGPLSTSSAGGRASLQTLLAEPDFTTASFLLSVLGEGTFLDLLRFVHQHAPDPVTADVTRLALRDEGRHVAFGVAHTAHLTRADPSYLGTLRQAVERRHAALLDTAGLNAEVFDALVLLAAGSWQPAAIGAGWQAVQDLRQRMDEGRRRRLAYVGFPDDEAAALSALHTRNFM